MSPQNMNTPTMQYQWQHNQISYSSTSFPFTGHGCDHINNQIGHGGGGQRNTGRTQKFGRNNPTAGRNFQQRHNFNPVG